MRVDRCVSYWFLLIRNAFASISTLYRYDVLETLPVRRCAARTAHLNLRECVMLAVRHMVDLAHATNSAAHIDTYVMHARTQAHMRNMCLETTLRDGNATHAPDCVGFLVGL